MILVTVKNISISNVGFVVFLGEPDNDEQALPIFIGVAEAQSIALHLNNVKPPRPMTHDLMVSMLDLFNAELDHVLIHTLQDGTFFARLILKCEGAFKELDARPSDAIALALRTGSSIYVAEEVMEQGAVEIADEQDENEETEKNRRGGGAAATEPIDELTRLKRKLEAAVKEERYEDAAQLRDEIKHHETRN